MRILVQRKGYEHSLRALSARVYRFPPPLQARQLVPAMPLTNDASVQAARMGVFAQVLAPGLGGGLTQVRAG